MDSLQPAKCAASHPFREAPLTFESNSNIGGMPKTREGIDDRFDLELKKIYDDLLALIKVLQEHTFDASEEQKGFEAVFKAMNSIDELFKYIFNEKSLIGSSGIERVLRALAGILGRCEASNENAGQIGGLRMQIESAVDGLLRLMGIFSNDIKEGAIPLFIPLSWRGRLGLAIARFYPKSSRKGEDKKTKRCIVEIDVMTKEMGYIKAAITDYADNLWLEFFVDNNKRRLIEDDIYKLREGLLRHYRNVLVQIRNLPARVLSPRLPKQGVIDAKA